MELDSNINYCNTLYLPPNSADLIEKCDKYLFRSALNPAHCLHSILYPKKNIYGCTLKKKDHGRELPLAKTKLYKDSFLMHCIYDMFDLDCKLCIGRELI